jgi:hypothetical protein
MVGQRGSGRQDPPRRRRAWLCSAHRARRNLCVPSPVRVPLVACVRPKASAVRFPRSAAYSTAGTSEAHTLDMRLKLCFFCRIARLVIFLICDECPMKIECGPLTPPP